MLEHFSLKVGILPHPTLSTLSSLLCAVPTSLLLNLFARSRSSISKCLSVSLFLCGIITCPPNRNSTGALDGSAVFGLMQTMERERTAYEYQEGMQCMILLVRRIIQKYM